MCGLPFALSVVKVAKTRLHRTPLGGTVRSRISVSASDMGKGKGGVRTPSNTYILAANSLGINSCDALPRDIGPKDAG